MLTRGYDNKTLLSKADVKICSNGNKDKTEAYYEILTQSWSPATPPETTSNICNPWNTFNAELK